MWGRCTEEQGLETAGHVSLWNFFYFIGGSGGGGVSGADE